MTPSRLYLPKLERPPGTIFEYLLERFPHVQACEWRKRLSQGEVSLSDNTICRDDSPYRHGLTVFYRKEVQGEPAACEEARVVYRDSDIIVVDKPHGMPVTPSGEYVERSLFVSLQRSTELPELAPMHRLDRDTAGLLLFAIKKRTRALYHRMFADGTVEREYLAIAHRPYPSPQTHWRVENRMESGEPWFRQRIVEGPVNAITEIELVDAKSGFGQFRLFPKTGKKHQLRVHLMSIGCPIVGDFLYPEIRTRGNNDFPLQLLARRLAFIDPLNGISRNFVSSRQVLRIQTFEP